MEKDIGEIMYSDDYKKGWFDGYQAGKSSGGAGGSPPVSPPLSWPGLGPQPWAVPAPGPWTIGSPPGPALGRAPNSGQAIDSLPKMISWNHTASETLQFTCQRCGGSEACGEPMCPLANLKINNF